MKRFLVWSLAGIILLSMSCKIEGEFWVNNAGTGHGILYVSDVPMITKEGLYNDLQKEFDRVSVTELRDGRYKAEVKWSDFHKPFKSRRKNEDDTIFLNFGEATPGVSTYTVHVDGKIDQGKSNGRLVNSSTIVFSSGPATLVYSPDSPITTILVVLAFALIVSILIHFYAKRRAEEAK